MEIFKNDVDWHNESLWFVREKRDIASSKLEEWEDLRQRASQIKSHTLSKLDYYLEEFEKNCKRNGIVVHWAVDGDELCSIVEQICSAKKAKKILKSKSMLTEECGLNPYLQKAGYEVIDTDLGERIVQLNHEPPSHIVLPAIHLKKGDVAKIFEQNSGDATYLTRYARENLRSEFLSCDVAISGVNFGVVDEGCFVVCTNEGNADLATSLCDTHIACMGIEKLVPKLQDLGIFTRLLARSATGQAITTYTTHFKKPAPSKEIHLIITDNGRSDLLGRDDFENALKCIRCGACMNTCPVFRRVGGHSYSYTIPGPIGVNLGASRDIEKYGKMSFASTLCGSCTNVCPTKIDLHHQLLAYRNEYKKVVKEQKDTLYILAYRVLKSDFLYKSVMKIAKYIPYRVYKNLWGEGRVTPKVAKKSFRELWDE